MDNAELERLLLDTPAKIKQEELGLIMLLNVKATNEREIEDIEAPIKAEVGLNCNFKNPEQRKGAVIKLLNNNPEYQQRVDKQPEYDFAIKKSQTELAYLRDMFRAYIAIAQMGAKP